MTYGRDTAAPVIIEAAINGVTPKSVNTNVPLLPDEIASDALECLAAGAAVVHNHVDVVMVDGVTAAERYLAGWSQIWDKRPEALLYATVNAGPVEMSFSHFPLLAQAGCRIGVVDTGSVNLGPFVYQNSAADIDYQVAVCSSNRLGPSMAIFEPGFLRTAVTLWRAGKIPPGAQLKLYFGGEGGYLGGVFGLPPTPVSFEAYYSMLGECPLPWSVAVIGGDVVGTGIARLALERGGHLHVGLEDWAGTGEPKNEELVQEAAYECARVGRPVATHPETVSILGLPPQNRDEPG